MSGGTFRTKGEAEKEMRKSKKEHPNYNFKVYKRYRGSEAEWFSIGTRKKGK